MNDAAIAFRRNSEKWLPLSELLSSNPILQEALAIATQPDTQALPVGVSSHDMARALGEQQERARIVPRLSELSTPLPQPTPQPRETFGTPHTVDEFDEVNTP